MRMSRIAIMSSSNNFSRVILRSAIKYFQRSKICRKGESNQKSKLIRLNQKRLLTKKR
jgi:hypothetical protein